MPQSLAELPEGTELLWRRFSELMRNIRDCADLNRYAIQNLESPPDDPDLKDRVIRLNGTIHDIADFLGDDFMDDLYLTHGIVEPPTDDNQDGQSAITWDPKIWSAKKFDK